MSTGQEMRAYIINTFSISTIKIKDYFQNAHFYMIKSMSNFGEKIILFSDLQSSI